MADNWASASDGAGNCVGAVDAVDYSDECVGVVDCVADWCWAYAIVGVFGGATLL